MSQTAASGMISIEQLSELVRDDLIDTVLLVFPDLYGRLMGKRLDGEFFINHARTGTHACDYLLTVDMEMEPVQGYRYSNWQTGYGDFQMVPDMATMRVASWLEKTALVICEVVDPSSHERVSVAPRSILQRQLEQASSLGYQAMAASELEYYLFRDSFRDAAAKGYADIEPAGWYIEDYHAFQGTREESFTGTARRHLRQSGIPVESSKGEWGRGQHELNVRYAQMLTMADRHSVFKQCLREIADQQGVSVTFMAKIDEKQAGSSCHIHLSLWQDGANAFAGDQRFGNIECSDLFRWFLGGWIAHVPEMMVFYAPNVNSYKRYRSESWAPTRLGVSLDNRTAAFRVVGSGQSLRPECRLPGADCNPYLAFAAAMASGLDGIAKQIEPPEIFTGDVYSASELPRVPETLSEATKLFEQSDFVKETFGGDVVEHYAHFFHAEQQAYDRAVTDWERRRYFERI